MSLFNALSMSPEDVTSLIKQSLENDDDFEDYTFEERYCKNTERVVKPRADERDRIHITRLETMVSSPCNEIFTQFKNNCFSHPKKIALIWMDGEGVEEERWTYMDLYEKARVVAASLRRKYNIQKGDRVLMVYEPCIHFFAAFWGLVGAGIIAVPVCPPDPFSPDNDAVSKLVSIVKDCDPKIIITTKKYKDSIAAARVFIGPAKFDKIMATRDNILDLTKRLWVATDDVPIIPASQWTFENPDNIGMNDRDIVFLQYTSGSTGSAKGVMVQHRTLAANVVNCTLLTQGLSNFDVYQFSIGVSWLPTFHDMGLIGFHIMPMLVGGTMINFSPLDFIKNPIVWLKIISRFRSVSSGAPTFGLDLCVRRVTPEEHAEIDLSGLEVLVLGAEPIRASYMDAFTNKFPSFNPNAYIPCYGLAENILHASGKWTNQHPARKICIDSKELAQHKLVVYDDLLVGGKGDKDKPWIGLDKSFLKPMPEGADVQWLVSSGELINFLTNVTITPEESCVSTRKPHFYRREVASTIAIVNPETLEECKDGEVGEIWVTGPSKTVGYYKKPDVNKINFEAILAKAVKPETQALLDFAKKTYDKPVPYHDLSRYNAEELLANTEPLLRLVHNVFTNDGEVKWLRSGDRGVIVDNNLFITGRIKDMIIIRGQNIYADDVEHAITGGVGIDDVGVDRASAEAAKLNFLRPGSAVAYSSYIHSDGSANCLATKYKVEGEHLCLMVELAEDVINVETNASDESLTARVKRKSGHQMPYYQRWLMKHGGALVGGMSSMYHEQESQMVKRLKGYSKDKPSCNTRLQMMVQQALLVSVRQCIVGANFGYNMYKHYVLGDDSGGSLIGYVKEDADPNDTSDEVKLDHDTIKIGSKFTDRQLDEIASAIRKTVLSKFLVSVSKVVFLAPRTVLKTSSGKKRRSEMVNMDHNGELESRIVKVSWTRPLQRYHDAKAGITQQQGSQQETVKASE